LADKLKKKTFPFFFLPLTAQSKPGDKGRKVLQKKISAKYFFAKTKKKFLSLHG